MRVIILLTVCFLFGCGGGSSPTTEVIVRTPNFTQPVLAGTYKIYPSGSTASAVQDIFVQDLDNDNVEEVIFAGRMSQPATRETWQNSQISIFCHCHI